MLSKDWNCIVVTLPLYDTAEDHSGRWGPSFDEISDMLAEAVKKHKKDEKVTLILHDAGTVYGRHLHKRYPELVDKIALLDIG